MSVDVCLVQVSPEQLASFEEQPAALTSFVEEVADGLSPQKLDDPIGRLLYVEEFAKSLLTDLVAAHSPFEPIHRAIIFLSHTLGNVGSEYGVTGFHTAEEVRSIYESLDSFAQADLQALVHSRLALLRNSYSEADLEYLRAYFQHIHLVAEQTDIGEAVRQYQQVCFQRLVAFFKQASQQDNAMLLIVR